MKVAIAMKKWKWITAGVVSFGSVLTIAIKGLDTVNNFHDLINDELIKDLFPEDKSKVFLSVNFYEFYFLSVSLVFLLCLIFIYIKAINAKRTQFFDSIKSGSFDNIDSDLCGLYYGIRRMAGNEKEKEMDFYYGQFLRIIKNKNRGYMFELYGLWDDKDYLISGDCLRIGSNIALYGLTNGRNDTFQVYSLEYPEIKEDIDGVMSLTRIKDSAAMASRVTFKKIDQNAHDDLDIMDINILKINRSAAARFDRASLLENPNAISISGSKRRLIEMIEYIDSYGDYSGILHS